MIAEEAVVSCYVDAASLLVMNLLLILSVHIRRRQNASSRIFVRLISLVTITCVISFIYHAMQGRTEPWRKTVVMTAVTLEQICILVIVCTWLLFVDMKLYGDLHPNTSIRVIRMIPVTLFLGVLIVNLFTGIAFTPAENNRMIFKPLYYLMEAGDLLLFLSSALTVWYYDRRTEKMRFLHIAPMILSLTLSLLPSLFIPYSTSIIGFAIGSALLYISMADESRFLDEESGMYSKDFLPYRLSLAVAGGNDIRSALILETDGNLPAAHRILRSTLHRDRDVIRAEEKKFLVFSREASRTTIQYETSRVDEAVMKHNTEHPEEKVQISMRFQERKTDENPYTFLHTIMEEKEAGNAMKGIVSMISELDRLDKELKLAADIQLSVLPMVFPPFPDRTEFDVYASMTPAKEVGGDFYDFFLIDSDHLALVIADVSGKGIPAALFMMTSRTLLRNQIMADGDPAAAMSRVNQQLSERNSSMMFVTVWAAVLEISTGKGLACNAGHEHPGLRHDGGSFELLKYKHGMLVGVSKKAKYENREFTMAPGDCVFVYTDGVPEANSDREGMFGEERLTDALNRKADAEPEELVRFVHSEVDRFADSTPQFDDITMLCFKYYGPQKRDEEPEG